MRVFSAALAIFLLIGCAAIAFADDPVSDVADVSPLESSPDTVSSDAASTSSDDLSVSADEAAAADPAVDAETDANNDVSDDNISDSVSADTVSITANNVMLASVADNNDYPADAPLMGGLYMDVSTSELGDVLVYVPTDYQYKSFTKTTSGYPVNITADTITGYSFDGSSYYIRWTSFGTAQYRTVSSSGSYSYTWNTLTITDINNTNIVFVESNEDLPPVPDSDTTNIITIFLLGVVVLCLFMKRF